MLSQNREGIILYIGEVHFAKGIWVGLELVNGAVGAHDGIVDKKRYFQTAPKRGIFVKESHIKSKVDATPKVDKRSYSMDLNDPNFAKEEKEKLEIMHPLEPSKSYSNGSDHSTATPSHSAQSAHSHNHLDIVMDDREDSRPLSTKSVGGGSNYDIMEFKEMVRAEVEVEWQAKFDEFKKMMIKETKHHKGHKHRHRRKKRHKHRKDKKKRKRNKSKRRKDKKQLNKLKEMEKRRKDRSKSRGVKLKSSEDEIKTSEHVKSVSLNIEIEDFDPDEVEQVTAESEEYRKNSDLNVNEEEFAFETDDDDDEQKDDVNDMDPIGLSLHVRSSSAGDADALTSNMMSDFDEKDIGYTNQLAQDAKKGKHKLKLW